MVALAVVAAASSVVLTAVLELLGRVMLVAIQ
jgi:hypothetical protein